MSKQEIIPSPEHSLQISGEDIKYLRKALNAVRDEFRDNPYILETQRVLTVKGYRSAIGSYWNAVVDDLRRKILHRSLDLFNKEMNPRREIRSYEDFQQYVTDYDLIEGAYKIGILSWEAKKLLHQARETRHIFDGHPASSEPSAIKVMDMIIDCNKYVLSLEYPPAVVNTDDYIANMDSANYHRDEIAVEQALGDLPDVYKAELTNRFFDIYKHTGTSTTLRSNIEFSAPILWRFLPRDTKHQIGRRVDKELQSGNQAAFEQTTRFLSLVDGSLRYTATATRQAIFSDLITQLENNLDNWEEEGRVCGKLEQTGMSIPERLLERYVSALTLTYVGYQGWKTYHSWSAAPKIRRMFESFDERSAETFVECVKQSTKLKSRIGNKNQLDRLRTLANILLERANPRGATKQFLELLVDDKHAQEFYRTIGR